MILIIPGDLLFFQGQKDAAQSTQACVIQITDFQVILCLHFGAAMEEEQIPFSESCFGKSCAGSRGRNPWWGMDAEGSLC